MSLKKFHFYFGLAMLAGFGITGFYMRFNVADVPAENIPVRMMFRANHIYILLASFLHLLISFIKTDTTKKYLGLSGNIISIAASITLFASFFIDPVTNSLERDITRASITGLAAGMAILVLNFKLSSRSKAAGS